MKCYYTNATTTKLVLSNVGCIGELKVKSHTTNAILTNLVLSNVARVWEGEFTIKSPHKITLSLSTTNLILSNVRRIGESEVLSEHFQALSAEIIHQKFFGNPIVTEWDWLDLIICINLWKQVRERDSSHYTC